MQKNEPVEKVVKKVRQKDQLKKISKISSDNLLQQKIKSNKHHQAICRKELRKIWGQNLLNALTVKKED